MQFARFRQMYLDGHKCKKCGQVLRLGNNGGPLCCKVDQRRVNKIMATGAGRTLKEITDARVKEALDMTNGNKKGAASLVGMNLRTFYRYVARAGLTVLAFLFFTSAALAAQVSLSWTAPTANADGTPLTDLAGYSIHWGTSSGAYTQKQTLGNQVTATISLSTGTWFIAVKAFDDKSPANVSGFSNEVSITIVAPPPPPDTSPPNAPQQLRLVSPEGG